MTNDAVNSVLYNIDQRLDTTAADKKMARDNIGALSADDVGGILGNYKSLQVPVELTFPDYAIVKKLTQDTNGVVDMRVSYISTATQSTDGLLSATDKTKLDGIQANAEVNVQSDWSESDSSSDAFIRNKPTIPAAQINSDWNASSGVAEILNKPSIPSVTTTTEGPDETIVVPVNHLDFNIDNFTVKAGSSTLGTLAPVTTPTEQRVLTLDANDPVPYWAVASGIGTNEVFIATYGSTTYQQISDALAAGKAVILRYGGSDIPISSSTATRHGFLEVRREGHSYAQQADSTRAFIVETDDTWQMNSVPVAYNVLAGAGLTYMVNGNDLTLSVSASFMPDLKYLDLQTVSVTQDTTLNIEDGYSYVLNLNTNVSPLITLSTNSTTTLHSLIAVKNISSTGCNSVTIRYYDETNTYHDIYIQLYETTNEYDFYVDIRKVTIGNTTASIARVYDMPCMWRNGSGGTPQYQSDTAWIGLLS